MHYPIKNTQKTSCKLFEHIFGNRRGGECLEKAAFLTHYANSKMRLRRQDKVMEDNLHMNLEVISIDL